jgi:hypothetical protein
MLQESVKHQRLEQLRAMLKGIKDGTVYGFSFLTVSEDVRVPIKALNRWVEGQKIIKSQKENEADVDFAKRIEKMMNVLHENVLQWFKRLPSVQSILSTWKDDVRLPNVFDNRKTKGMHLAEQIPGFEGLKTLKDIFNAANCSFELMHTVSTYPMRDEDANLLVINTLRHRFNCNVGYSGHEVGLAVSYGAAALGITSLERHITLDRSMYGSDQSASIEPNGLRMLVGAVRKIEKAMGDGVKKILDAEVPIAHKLREHINLQANH